MNPENDTAVPTPETEDQTRPTEEVTGAPENAGTPEGEATVEGTPEAEA